ncbi:MAG: hypothetical protein KAI35_03995 [Desulfobulbaceae bacterium]|nr:hypothetical protein [Desulfobulbaceae bacterium]
MTKITEIVPLKNFILAGICASGILAFCLLAILPNKTALIDLNKKIHIGEARLNAQQILFPLYENIKEKAQLKTSEIFSAPEKTKLSREERERIPAIFREIAGNCTLKFKEAIPDISSLSGASRLLTVNLGVEGDFINFRDFLIQLYKVPFLEHIEQIEIHRIEDSILLELNMKILLAQA